MDTLRISKTFSFDAAHRLGRHLGKCGRLHGHTYTLEVELRGRRELQRTPGQGMVLDYYILNEIVQETILSKVDHQNLNEVLADDFLNNPEIDNVTTAENLTLLFMTMLTGALIKRGIRGVEVSAVSVSETPKTRATWRRDDQKSGTF